MDALFNISPVDGRYKNTTEPLREYFSEYALIRYRVFIEIEYFIALCNIPLFQLKDLKHDRFENIRQIARNFSDSDAVEVKNIEKTTNHDIKAVEYFIKQRFAKLGLGDYEEYVHFALTSQDINNTAIPLSFKQALDEVIIPALNKLTGQLKTLGNKYLNLPMLAYTHGQPASPTTLGKEVLVFYERLINQLIDLKSMPMPAKFGGTTGNFNAHHVACPEIDWIAFANQFTQSLGLKRSRLTTQIDHYDGLSALFDCLKRICTIIIDLDRDFWSYISMEYLKQKIKTGEVGSSAMPHKVNPIDFENSEGNAGVATALFEHLSAKLPVSRLQRDLTDSTVIRNIGVACAHMLIAIKSCIRGLTKIDINTNKIEADLESNALVVAEAIQTVLRTLNYPKPYETLKTLTRTGQKVSLTDILNFIKSLDIPEEEKHRLSKIEPCNYIGILPDKME